MRVGIDLVADQEHDIGPAPAWRLAQAQGVADQRVPAVLRLVPGASLATCRDREISDPAETEDQP